MITFFLVVICIFAYFFIGAIIAGVATWLESLAIPADFTFIWPLFVVGFIIGETFEMIESRFRDVSKLVARTLSFIEKFGKDEK